MSSYQLCLYSVALSLGYKAYLSEGDTEQAHTWLLHLWELIRIYNQINLQSVLFYSFY